MTLFCIEIGSRTSCTHEMMVVVIHETFFGIVKYAYFFEI